jgi:hypothetical protein
MAITHTDLFLGVWQRVGNFTANQASEPIVLTGRDLTIADVITAARLVLLFGCPTA